MVRKSAFFIRVGAAALVFGIAFTVAWVAVGRRVWSFVEREVDPESFRVAMLNVGPALGIAPITSLDSHLHAISSVAEFVALPWAIAFGLLCVLAFHSVVAKGMVTLLRVAQTGRPSGKAGAKE